MNEKKKYFFLVFMITAQIITILCVIFLLAFLASGSKNSMVYNKNNPYMENQESVFYNIKADVQVSGKIVYIKQDIFFTSPQNSIHLYIPSANLADTEIKKVITDGKSINEIKANTNIEISCEKPQEKVGLEYEIRLDNQRQTLSYSDDCILLTNFLVTPAVYRDNKPILTYKWPYGDPYIYGMNNYDVRLKADKSYNFFGPGEKSEKISGNERTAEFTPTNVRDLPLVLIRNATVKSEKHGGTTVYYINSYAAREYVNAALKYAEKNIGPYPYKDFFVIKAPISSNKGMEFSRMVFLSDECFGDGEILKRVAYHEVFHQWFYGIIGTDQLNEPFLDEGLANYLSLLLAGDKLGSNYNSRFLKMHLSSYYSKDEYINLAYNNASLYFSDIHKRLGNRFFNMLQNIYNKKKNSILYYDDLLKYAG